MISRNRRLRLVSWKLAAPMAVLLWWNPAAAQDNSIMEIGSKRELFVDGYLIEKSSGVRLQLHHPMPKEIVMHHDKLWEGNGCNYYSIFRDGDLFRMYYDSWAHEPSSIPVHDVFIGYAESKDGKTWTRPDVGRFEFNGSKKNNIVWASENLDNWGGVQGHESRLRPGGPVQGLLQRQRRSDGGAVGGRHPLVADRRRSGPDRRGVRQPQPGLLGPPEGPLPRLLPGFQGRTPGHQDRDLPGLHPLDARGSGWSTRGRRTSSSTPTTSFPTIGLPTSTWASRPVTWTGAGPTP